MANRSFVLDPLHTNGDTSASEVDIVLPSVSLVPAALAPTDPKTEEAAARDVVLELDPESIHVSGAPNRLDESFDTEDFEALRLSMAAGRRNAQPILVSPLGGDPGVYELIAGERRLRVCIIEKLKVRAILVERGTTEADWIVERIRENSGREDPKPYETAQQIKFAARLLKPRNLTELAARLGLTLSKVSRAMSLADVPEDVIDAFPSRRDIRVADIKPLKQLLEGDLDAVRREVAAIRSSAVPVTASSVLKRLQQAATSSKVAPAVEERASSEPKPTEPQPLLCYGQRAGHWSQPKHGPLTLQIDVSLSDQQRASFLQIVAGHLERKVLPRPKVETPIAVVALPSAQAGREPDDEASAQRAIEAA